MQFEDLEVFRAIAYKGSLSRAAAALNMSQPTVSRRLKNLESHIGAELVDRSAIPIHLTPEGILLLEFAETLLDRWQQLGHAVQSTHDVGGIVSIASSTAPARSLVMPVLAEFLRAYGDVRARVSVMDSSRVLAEVSSEEADLGFTGRRPPADLFVAEPVAQDEIMLVVPNTGPFKHLTSPVGWTNLSELPFVERLAGSGTRATVQEALDRAGITAEFHVVCEVDSNEAVVETVATGIGVGFASRQIVNLLGMRTVRMLTVQGLEMSRQLYLVKKRGLALAEAPNIFLQFLSQKNPHMPV